MLFDRDSQATGDGLSSFYLLPCRLLLAVSDYLEQGRNAMARKTRTKSSLKKGKKLQPIKTLSRVGSDPSSAPMSGGLSK